MIANIAATGGIISLARGNTDVGSTLEYVAAGLGIVWMLAMVTVRAFRGHFSSQMHMGVEVPGIYWHFVDVMWIVVYTTVYIL